MTHESTVVLPDVPTLPAAQVYFLAAFCLGAGLIVGYVLRSPQPASPAKQNTIHALAADSSRAPAHRPSLEDMKVMADKQAAPLLEKLKSRPDDSSLLVQVAAIYHTTHQFKEAASYYKRAVESDPKNVAVRTKLASSLYRSGDIDGAIAELNSALKDQPTDANALFDLGLIKLQGKGDDKGALATWQLLLKTNPQLSPERKAVVLKMMADVMTMMGDQHGIRKARTTNGHQ